MATRPAPFEEREMLDKLDQSEPTGPELIDKIGEFPTVDILLDRDPHAEPYTINALVQLVEAFRRDRARFNIKDEKKAAKKDGIEEVVQ